MKIFKTILTFLIISLIFTLNSSSVQAVGDLNVNWNVPDGQPIFSVNNMLPGDLETRTVQIINNGSSIRPVAIKGKYTSGLLSFADVLDFKISENEIDLYGGTNGAKTLKDFFEDSGGIGGINLFSLNPSQTKTIIFTVKFPELAGNEFQNNSIVFDITIGISFEIPEECKNIVFSGEPIFGTGGKDTLNGTAGNDLIFGFEGDDIINGKAGDDCLVGGAGNDTIHGQNGNDIIFGDEGDDRLWGDNGKDKIYGGSGNDRIEANNDDDYVDAGDGQDSIDGGNGTDICLNGETLKNCEPNSCVLFPEVQKYPFFNSLTRRLLSQLFGIR